MYLSSSASSSPFAFSDQRCCDLSNSTGLALFFYAIQQELAFDLVRHAFIGIFATYQITHSVFCLWK
jgi:hypothetical protein